MLILAKLVICLISKIFLARRWNIDLCSFKWDCFSDSSSSSGWKIDFFVFAPHYHLCQISVCTSVEPKPQVLLTKRVHPLWQNCVAKQIYSFYAARGEDLKFIWTLAIPKVVSFYPKLLCDTIKSYTNQGLSITWRGGKASREVNLTYILNSFDITHIFKHVECWHICIDKYDKIWREPSSFNPDWPKQQLSWRPN